MEELWEESPRRHHLVFYMEQMGLHLLSNICKFGWSQCHGEKLEKGLKVSILPL